MSSSRKFPVVKKTPALNRFLNFLQEYKGNNEVEVESTDELTSLLVDAKEIVIQHADEKHLFHLALVICLSDGDMEKVFSNGENEDLVSCLIDPADAPKISKESYCDLVVELGLVEESLCMVLANPEMRGMTEIAAGIAEIITRKEDQFAEDLCDFLLTNLVKLARLDDDKGDCYTDSFLKILDWVMKRTVLEKHEKLALTFRLSGIVLLQSPDESLLQDEITELWKEWCFDKSDCSSKKSSTLFEVLFRTKPAKWAALPVNWKVLCALNEIVPDFAFYDQDLLGLESTCCTSELNYLNFIGGCAYITNTLLQKISTNVRTNDVSALQQKIEEWAVKKPKMKVEDFIVESSNFSEFCKNMEDHGNRTHYQTEWLQKFLTFSHEDIFMTSEGLRMAEKFIVTSSELNIIQEYAKMAYNTDSFELSDDVKKLILKMFTDNEEVILQRDKVIKALFENGASGKFRTREYFCSVSALVMQLGNIEFQEEVELVEQNIASVTVIALQDPGPTLTKLLEQSMRTQHFKALEYARPFFRLPICYQNELESEDPYQSMLLNQSFHILLKAMFHPSSLCDSVLNSIDVLISKDILNPGCIFRVLKYQILKDLKRNKVFLSKIVGLVCVLEKLVDFLLMVDGTVTSVLETELLINIGKFVIRLNRFFTMYTNASTFSNAMKIRNGLVIILEKLIPTCGEKISCVTPETLDNLEDMITLDLGFLYVRNENLRSEIKRLFSEDNFGENLFRDPTQLLSNIIEWVINSCEREWEYLVMFLFEVLLGANYTSKRGNKFKLHTLNQVLKSVYSISLDLKSPDIFLHMFKFYLSAIDHLTLKGQIRDVDRNDILDTLVFIGFMMSCRSSERQKEVVGLHQVLMFLLDKVEEAADGSYSLDITQKLVSSLNGYKDLDNQCESVRWLILKKLESLHSLTA
ncbi:unnamed protein product [Orchesella dallaii]|uniref:Uncharacterized protein n=1 Tax=Orchesella dallaii TaxID=48710 RepID=A0ABP1Q4P7_9HEXA